MGKRGFEEKGRVANRKDYDGLRGFSTGPAVSGFDFPQKKNHNSHDSVVLMS